MYTHTYVTFFEQKIGDKETRKRRRRRTIKLQRMNKKCWTIKACGSANRFSPQRSDKFPRIPFTTTPSYQKFLHFTVSARFDTFKDLLILPRGEWREQIRRLGESKLPLIKTRWPSHRTILLISKNSPSRNSNSELISRKKRRKDHLIGKIKDNQVAVNIGFYFFIKEKKVLISNESERHLYFCVNIG